MIWCPYMRSANHVYEDEKSNRKGIGGSIMYVRDRT